MAISLMYFITPSISGILLWMFQLVYPLLEFPFTFVVSLCFSCINHNGTIQSNAFGITKAILIHEPHVLNTDKLLWNRNISRTVWRAEPIWHKFHPMTTLLFDVINQIAVISTTHVALRHSKQSRTHWNNKNNICSYC